MARKTSPIQINGALIPVLTAAAGALAALAWIVPLPMLRVPDPPELPVPVEAPAAPAEPAGTRYTNEPWAPLASSLERLRDKAPEVPVPTPETNETPVVAAAPVPTIPPLGWHFKGTIDGPGGRAALVIIRDGRTKFVFVGQSIPDVGNPGGPAIIVREIEADHIIVERDGNEERIELQKTELAAPHEPHFSNAGFRK